MGRIRKRDSRVRRHQELINHWGNILIKVMVDHDISNEELATWANVNPSRISVLRNGVLSQANYIIIIRALPEAARIDYLNQIFDLNLKASR